MAEVDLMLMPDWNGVSEDEFPESIVDEMVDDEYGPSHEDEDD